MPVSTVPFLVVALLGVIICGIELRRRHNELEAFRAVFHTIFGAPPPLTWRDTRGNRRAIAQLRQLQRLQMLGRLAGGLAHDINNTLTAISGFAELVLNDGATTGRRADDVREIVRECDLAAALTRQLLTFGRPHTSRPQPTDFNNMIETIERMAQRLIGEDVECRIVLDPAAEYIMADRTQVEQVLINLIVNARDAMPRGGTLTLETADVVVDERSAAAHGGGVMPGRYVMLHVRDTGTGMDQSTMDRMFAPFFTTKHGGTGLGLATVYDIVKQHGGFIEAESLLGVGTTFTLYFPVVAFSKNVAAEETSTSTAGAELSVAAPSARVPASTHTAVQGTAEKTATPETQTVLVVEDDRVVRHLVRNTLRGQGYHVLYAADGTEALEIAKSYAGKIDLLFTDIVMPRMHGLDLATALAELRPSLRVIYTSGYALETVVPETPPEMDFLPKPYMPSTLLQRIRETLEMA